MKSKLVAKGFLKKRNGKIVEHIIIADQEFAKKEGKKWTSLLQ